MWFYGYTPKLMLFDGIRNSFDVFYQEKRKWTTGLQSVNGNAGTVYVPG